MPRRRLIPPETCNVYTPAVLADAIACALPDSDHTAWLDPCVGKGAFLEAVARRGTPASRVTGIDLSAKLEAADRFGAVQRVTEFLSWSSETFKRFDNIVANPPYISLRELPIQIRQAALKHQSPDGTKLTLRSNCWYAFLCAALRLLKSGGSLAFVLPAAFEYADYARPLRVNLSSLFRTVGVHRCRVPIFEAVGDGAVVLIASGFGKPLASQIRREYNSLSALARGICHYGAQEKAFGAFLSRRSRQSVQLLGT